ncbi:MAG: hypothetical protein R3250_03770 [Melioribacteraceae bacterium]|nr:hypothetical protein [Melioribacteraceae bacterium]
MKFRFSLILVYLLISINGYSQPNLDEKPLKIFFDSYGSLFRYVQSDINFVDIVRNPSMAEIHILLNIVRTGSGGRKYTLTFVGQNGFEGRNDTLRYNSIQNSSRDQINEDIVRLIKIGLIRYLAETPYAKYVNIDFDKEFDDKPIEDKWDRWVFGIGVNSSFRAEESRKQIYWELDFDIDRVSEESKFTIDLKINNQSEIYTSDEGESKSYKRARYLRTLYVLSISDHFSAGFFSGYTNSTYRNLKTAINFSPAVEYNIFPYQESVRRNFTFLYRIGYEYQDYYNETIYFKNWENLFKHSLSIGYRINETWGDARFFLTANSYLHDMSKTKVELWSRFAYRISGSLSINVQGDVSYVNDQLYLEQKGATLEEILLNQKSLATQYEYQLRLGFQYTFGSIFNNVVNTRF